MEVKIIRSSHCARYCIKKGLLIKASNISYVPVFIYFAIHAEVLEAPSDNMREAL